MHRSASHRAIIPAIFLLFSTVSPVSATSLDTALRAALGNSLTLQSSRQDWLAAHEDIGVAVSTSEWRTNGTVTGTQTKKDAANASKTGFLDSQSASATLSLSRNLYDGGQTRENTELRQIQADMAEAKYRVAEQQVLIEAIDTYLEVVKTRKEVDLNRANVGRLEEHVTAARVRLEAGASTQTALAQAESRLSRARTTLIAALTAMRNAEDAFLTQTGIEAGEVSGDIDPGVLLPTLLEADESARQNNPSVTVARLSVDIAKQQFNALLASVRPSVAFSLKATESMAEGKASDKTEFAAQLQLSTPLMPTLSIRAKSRGLAASLEAARLRRDDTFRQVSLDVRNAFRNLETARAQLAAVQSELKALRLVAEGINNEFQFGQKTTLDLLDAEQDVNDAEMRRVNADHAVLMASFRLRAASGTLSARSFGLDDVYGPLDGMEPIEPRFKRWVPLEIEWPEGTANDVSSGQSVPVDVSPGLAQIPAAATATPSAPDSAQVALAPAAPVAVAPVAAPILTPAPVIETVAVTAPASSQLVEVDGIIWDIRTTRP
ncbi:TolC family protein [Alphaproteobacteria bacterium LSUCC0719]